MVPLNRYERGLECRAEWLYVSGEARNVKCVAPRDSPDGHSKQADRRRCIHPPHRHSSASWNPVKCGCAAHIIFVGKTPKTLDSSFRWNDGEGISASQYRAHVE
jgi:hypothetical protein